METGIGWCRCHGVRRFNLAPPREAYRKVGASASLMSGYDLDVRFWPEADIASCTAHVRYRV
jgi:hypothetical protein